VAFDSQKILSNKLRVTQHVQIDGKTVTKYMPYIGDVMPKANADPDRVRLETNYADTKYFWSAPSRAYAQAVSGRVYIVIPKDQTINILKDNGDGSVWWTFEAPDLIRNPEVVSITYVSVDPTMDTYVDITGGLEKPMYEFGDEKIIWTRGNPPLGPSGDDRYMEIAPREACKVWMYLKTSSSVSVLGGRTFLRWWHRDSID
jgi:hypothetical protein